MNVIDSARAHAARFPQPDTPRRSLRERTDDERRVGVDPRAVNHVTEGGD